MHAARFTLCAQEQVAVQVEKAVKRLWSAARIFLFGSRAAGLSAGSKSDLDIGVIIPIVMQSMCVRDTTTFELSFDDFTCVARSFLDKLTLRQVQSPLTCLCSSQSCLIDTWSR